MSDRTDGAPAIEDHALLSDCASVALVARDATVDWWCAPRLDHGSLFGALLDARRGGQCAISVAEERAPPQRRYLDGTLVLETLLTDRDGVARVVDCLVLSDDAPGDPRAQLLRVLEPVDGRPRVTVRLEPRFDYGTATPWIRRCRDGFVAVAGDDGLQISGDVPLTTDGGDGVLSASFGLGERRRLSMRFVRPEVLDGADGPPPAPTNDDLDAALDATAAAWRRWSRRVDVPAVDGAGVLQSALTLRGLTVVRTGALVAAATTSLPESWQGRTWDYRAAWIRDASFAARSLAAVGIPDEADAFRRFVHRSSAGRAAELRIAYGPGGERRLPEEELDDTPGWRGIGPVRVGNAALRQHQADALGELLELTWRWHERGGRPDPDLWAFLAGLVDRAAGTWREPDRGFWEWRGEPRHFVHSKALCWVALDRGVRLARALGHDAPLERWCAERDACRASILVHGVNRDGAFVQAYGDDALDAAALRIPMVGLLPFDDERVARTTDSVLARLCEGGLVRRYDSDDGLPGREGAFIACTFWAAQVRARQGRRAEAEALFERALRTRNDVGLFAEEYDPARGTALGNFPQALTHLSHIDAALALGGQGSDRDGRPVKRAG
jgi:GH15 family glucan-1,4-alpha-glucosidase